MARVQQRTPSCTPLSSDRPGANSRDRELGQAVVTWPVRLRSRGGHKAGHEAGHVAGHTAGRGHPGCHTECQRVCQRCQTECQAECQAVWTHGVDMVAGPESRVPTGVTPGAVLAIGADPCARPLARTRDRGEDSAESLAKGVVLGRDPRSARVISFSPALRSPFKPEGDRLSGQNRPASSTPTGPDGANSSLHGGADASLR